MIRQKVISCCRNSGRTWTCFLHLDGPHYLRDPHPVRNPSNPPSKRPNSRYFVCRHAVLARDRPRVPDRRAQPRGPTIRMPRARIDRETGAVSALIGRAFSFFAPGAWNSHAGRSKVEHAGRALPPSQHCRRLRSIGSHCQLVKTSPIPKGFPCAFEPS